MLRIVVTGSESTGKTTLARDLAHALHAPWVAEYARDYAVARSRVLTAHDVEPIAHGQMAREDAAVLGAGGAPLIVLDTDLVSTTVYADAYYGACPQWIMGESRTRLGSLYLLCSIDLPWQADGVRDQPQARDNMQGRFDARLRDLEARVLPVAGTGPARLSAALAAVRGWLTATGNSWRAGPG